MKARGGNSGEGKREYWANALVRKPGEGALRFKGKVLVINVQTRKKGVSRLQDERSAAETIPCVEVAVRTCRSRGSTRAVKVRGFKEGRDPEK